ncbi:hypothetical protein HS125_16620 [bacterium]|nr:hypothetical protein [bacterium]
MVPNVFFSATAVRDNQVYADTKQVIVPPESQFITVELSPSAEDYPPGGEGAYDVKVTDASGAPVEARLMLSVADEAVYAIAPEYAPDVRRFFATERNDASADEARPGHTSGCNSCPRRRSRSDAGRRSAIRRADSWRPTRNAKPESRARADEGSPLPFKAALAGRRAGARGG